MLGLSPKQVIFLGLFIILLVVTPIGAVIVRRNMQLTRSQAKEASPIRVQTEDASPFQSVKDLLSPKASPSPTPEAGSAMLTLALSLEGRKPTDQADEVFIGIAEVETSPPKYQLTKSVQTDVNGKVTTSLSGLLPGRTYYLYVKGSQHLAASKSFVLKIGANDLSDTQLLLLVGDINADNVVDKFDQNLVQDAFNALPKDKNWNPLADVNRDQIVNNTDLALLAKNFGKSGAGGPWYSPTPSATGSAR